MKRRYESETRRAAAAATRERIVDAAVDAFLTRWYDEVTIQSLATAAGVSAQTVINHFGGKEGVFAAMAERLSYEIAARRRTDPDAGVEAAIDALVADYEVTGDPSIRALALEHRVAALPGLLDKGRVVHRAWVAETFDRPDLMAELLVATDVYAWKLLRRDQGLSQEATARSIRRTVLALLAWGPQDAESRS